MAVVLWTQAQWARRRWREVHGWAKQTITYCSSACNRYNGMNRLTELCRLSLIQTPPHGERQGASQRANEAKEDEEQGGEPKGKHPFSLAPSIALGRSGKHSGAKSKVFPLLLPFLASWFSTSWLYVSIPFLCFLVGLLVGD